MTNKIPVEIDRHIAFAEAYISNHRNATKAYKEVYGDNLSDETASVNGSKLLRTTKVRIHLQKKFGELELDASSVLRGIKEIADNGEQENTRLKALIWLGKVLGLTQLDYMEKEQTETLQSDRVKSFIEHITKIQEKNQSDSDIYKQTF